MSKNSMRAKWNTSNAKLANKPFDDLFNDGASKDVTISRQAARLLKLEVFVQKFLDNFDVCDWCNGKGVVAEEAECLDCHGTGKRIASIGVLYVELPDEANALLKVKP